MFLVSTRVWEVNVTEHCFPPVHQTIGRWHVWSSPCSNSTWATLITKHCQAPVGPALLTQRALRWYIPSDRGDTSSRLYFSRCSRIGPGMNWETFGLHLMWNGQGCFWTNASCQNLLTCLARGWVHIFMCVCVCVCWETLTKDTHNTLPLSMSRCPHPRWHIFWVQ